MRWKKNSERSLRMNRTRFIQGLNSNIELSDKERRRTIRNSINKRPWKLNCTIAMEDMQKAIDVKMDRERKR